MQGLCLEFEHKKVCKRDKSIGLSGHNDNGMLVVSNILVIFLSKKNNSIDSHWLCHRETPHIQSAGRNLPGDPGTLLHLRPVRVTNLHINVCIKLTRSFGLLLQCRARTLPLTMISALIPTSIPTTTPTVMPTFQEILFSTFHPEQILSRTSMPTSMPTSTPTILPAFPEFPFSTFSPEESVSRTSMPTLTPTLVTMSEPTAMLSSEVTLDPTIFPEAHKVETHFLGISNMVLSFDEHPYNRPIDLTPHPTVFDVIKPTNEPTNGRTILPSMKPANHELSHHRTLSPSTSSPTSKRMKPSKKPTYHVMAPQPIYPRKTPNPSAFTPVSTMTVHPSTNPTHHHSDTQDRQTTPSPIESLPTTAPSVSTRIPTTMPPSTISPYSIKTIRPSPRLTVATPKPTVYAAPHCHWLYETEYPTDGPTSGGSHDGSAMLNPVPSEVYNGCNVRRPTQRPTKIAPPAPTPVALSPTRNGWGTIYPTDGPTSSSSILDSTDEPSEKAKDITTPSAPASDDTITSSTDIPTIVDPDPNDKPSEKPKEITTPLSPATNNDSTPISNGINASLDNRNNFVGFQSDSRPVRAGSVFYSSARDSIYITGMTVQADDATSYERSTCFVQEISIDVMLLSPIGTRLDLLGSTFHGNKKNLDCNLSLYVEEKSKAIDDDGKSYVEDILYIGGAIVENDETARDGTNRAFLNSYQRRSNSPFRIRREGTIEFPFHGSSDFIETNEQQQRPVAMTNGKQEGSGTVVAILSIVGNTDDAFAIDIGIEEHDDEDRDITTTNNNNNDNLFQIHREIGFRRVPLLPEQVYNTGVVSLAYNEYKVAPDGEFVYLSGEKFSSESHSGSIVPTGLGNTMPDDRDYVVVGHRKGLPPKEWIVERHPSDNNADDDPTEDYDGFATTIAGDMLSIRFSSIERNPPLDDFVHGICMGPVNSDTGTIDSYYVFGSTYGTMPVPNNAEKLNTNLSSSGVTTGSTDDGNHIDRLSAWISKVDARERTVLWTTQFYATTSSNGISSLEGGKAEAVGCHVIDEDPTQMYLAGYVYDGGIIDSSQNIAGSDDVWIAKLSTDDGSIHWMRQIGSSSRDRIASTHGVTSDKNGHCIVYGETNGDLSKTRLYDDDDDDDRGNDDSTTTEIFVLMVDKDYGRSRRLTFDDAALPETTTTKTKPNVRITSRESILLFVLSILFIGIVIGQRIGSIVIGRRSARARLEDMNNKGGEDIPDHPRIEEGLPKPIASSRGQYVPSQF